MLFGRGQGLTGAQLLDHVVEVGEGKAGVQGLLALAVGIELFGQFPDARLLLRRGGREGECLETAKSVMSIHKRSEITLITFWTLYVACVCWRAELWVYSVNKSTSKRSPLLIFTSPL